MSVQGIRAGKAFVEFFINDDRINSGLAKISKQLSSWGRTGLKYSAPIAGAFGAAAAAFANSGSELYDMSRRTDVAVETLSMLKYAAEQSDVSMETLEKAFKGMKKNGLDPNTFSEIAADIAKIEDPVARTQAAMDLFGKAGYDIVPLLQDLPELNAQFQKLGITMSTSNAVAADALGDAFAASKAQFWGLVNTIGSALAGPLTQFLTWSQAIVANVIQWANENPRLFQTIAVIATAVAAVSSAMVAFGSVAAIMATAIGGISAAVTGLGVALGIVSANPVAWILGLVAAGAVGVAAIAGISSLGSSSVSTGSTAPVVAPAVGNQAATFSNRAGGDETLGVLRGIWDEAKETRQLIARNVFGLPAGAL